jgi:hypothetical protein
MTSSPFKLTSVTDGGCGPPKRAASTVAHRLMARRAKYDSGVEVSKSVPRLVPPIREASQVAQFDIDEAHVAA